MSYEVVLSPRVIGSFHGAMTFSGSLKSPVSSHIVLKKTWIICSEFVAKKSGLHEASPLQLPLQILLLVVKWLRLSLISWDDVLRLARRHGGNSSSPLLFDRTSFLQVLEESIQVHLMSVPDHSIDRFLLERWDRSNELSSLDWFLATSFEQTLGFSPASIFTGSVLDVLVAYRERWDFLVCTLANFGMDSANGIVMALGCLMNDSEAASLMPSNVNELFDLAPQWCAHVFHSSHVDKDSLWMTAAFCSVAIARRQSPEVQNAAQIRSAVLNLFGDTLGSLLLPQVAWRERLRIGGVKLLSAANEQRHVLRSQLELSMRQLYIHAASHGDQTGVSLLSAENLVQFLTETVSTTENLHLMASILEPYIGNMVLKLLDKNAKILRSAKPKRDSILITYKLFVCILEQISRINPHFDNLSSSLGEFLRQLSRTGFGRDARRTIAHQIAEEFHMNDLCVKMQPKISQVYFYIANQFAPRNENAKHEGTQRQKCSLTAASLLQVLAKTTVVPCIGSRADVCRILRSIWMDHGTEVSETFFIQEGDFGRFVCVLASLPKLQVPIDQAVEMILQTLSNFVLYC